MKRRLFPFMIMLTLLSGALLAYALHEWPAKASGSPLHVNAVTNSKAERSSTASTKSQNLVRDINAIIAQYPDLSVSVSVADLDTNKAYDAGATDATFKGASTIKVLTAVYYMHQVENGSTTLSQQIDGVTAQTLLQRMLQDSNNDAWADLINYLGESNIQSYAQSIGMASFSGYDYNTIKTSDYIKLLTRLYKGQLINSQDRDTLYSFMQNTDNETLIPAALPSGATVYHKWGDLWGNVHDVAIVEYQGHDFALVIYTNNSNGTQDQYDTQATIIRDITKTVVSDLTM